MEIRPDWFSPTRIAGLLACATSLLICVNRWNEYRQIRHRPGDKTTQSMGPKASDGGTLFGVLAWVQAGMLVDLAVNMRWILHEFWVHETMNAGVYEERRPWQALGLIVLGCLVGCCALVILRSLHRRVGASIAAVGTVVSAGLCCAEIISLHSVDGVLYYEIDGMMVISFIWVGLAMFTCWGVWLDGRISQAGQRA